MAVPGLADFVSVDLLTRSSEGGRSRWPRGPPLLRRVAHQSVLPGAPEAVARARRRGRVPGGLAAGGDPDARGVRAAPDRPGRGAGVGLRGPAARRPRIRDYGFHSLMAVPMSARGITLGVVVFAATGARTPSSADDLLLAEEIAARAAVCIDNARRYTRERATSLALQRSLLPQRLPEQPRWRSPPAISRPMRGPGSAATGSTSSRCPGPGSRWSSATSSGTASRPRPTMGRLRTAVRTLADIDLPPDELLTHLDDLVGRLATETDALGDRRRPGRRRRDLSVRRLRPASPALHPGPGRPPAARAGHPRRRGRSCWPCPPARRSAWAACPSSRCEIELPEGSLLALYTDGLIESRGRDSDVDEGPHRLLREALAAPAASLDEVCDTVLADLLPRLPADDVALLVARTRALDAAQVATWEVPSDPAAVARGPQARGRAAGAPGGWPTPSFVTELVVSELVTNAIRYGDPPDPAAAHPRPRRSSARSPTAAAPPPTCAGRAPSTRAAAACSWSPSSPSAGAPARRQGQDDLGGADHRRAARRLVALSPPQRPTRRSRPVQPARGGGLRQCCALY